MRRSQFLAAAVSAALALPGTSGYLVTLRAEKPRVADAVASFLDSLTAPRSASHGPTCGCGSYVPPPEPTCEAEPICGVEPTCGMEPVCGVEPLCGADVAGSIPSAYGSDAFAPHARQRHVPIRMRIQSHPTINVDRTFAPANRLPPAPKLPTVERELTPSSANSKPAKSPFVREPEPEPSASGPVASTPLPLPEPMPEPVQEPAPMPKPELPPEPEEMPVPEPMPNPKYDPVQAAPKARPARTKPAPPMPVIEEPAVPTVEEPAVPAVEAPAAPAFEAPAAPAIEEFVPPTAEAPLPEAEPAIPTPTTEPLLTVPAPATPSAAKLTPEPRRLAPPRPLSNSLPYDPTDPFADPPASDAPAPRATPTTQDRSPERLPTGPEIPRFGAEEFSPVGTGVIVQPTSGVASDRPAVRPAIRIVPVNDLPLYQAR